MPGESQAIGPNLQLARDGWLVPDSSKPKDQIRLGCDWHPIFDASTFTPDGKKFIHGTWEGVVLVTDIDEVRRRASELGR